MADATENKTSAYTITNNGRGPRYVNNGDTGRQVIIDPGQSASVPLTATEAKSAENIDGLTVEKVKGGKKAEPAPPKTPGTPEGGGPGGSADGRVTDADAEALKKTTPAYVAHEGLGRWHVFNEAGEKIAVPGEDGAVPEKPRPMTKEEAQTWATDAKVEFRAPAAS